MRQSPVSGSIHGILSGTCPCPSTSLILDGAGTPLSAFMYSIAAVRTASEWSSGFRMDMHVSLRALPSIFLESFMAIPFLPSMNHPLSSTRRTASEIAFSIFSAASSASWPRNSSSSLRVVDDTFMQRALSSDMRSASLPPVPVSGPAISMGSALSLSSARSISVQSVASFPGWTAANGLTSFPASSTKGNSVLESFSIVLSDS